MESITKIINEAPDSIEIGTPGRGGAIKVFGDFTLLETFRKKIDNAFIVRCYANEKMVDFDRGRVQQ